MTATIDETDEATQTQGGVGRIARVIGPVVDVEFPADAMPEMYNMLKTELELGGEKRTLTLEVAQHIGDGMVRALSPAADRRPGPRLPRSATPAARSPSPWATSPWATSSTRSATS